jgi:hypothetical protein
MMEFRSLADRLPRLSAFERFDEGTQLRIDENVRLEQMVNQLYIARPAMRVNGETVLIRRERRQYLLLTRPRMIVQL